MSSQVILQHQPPNRMSVKLCCILSTSILCLTCIPLPINLLLPCACVRFVGRNVYSRSCLTSAALKCSISAILLGIIDCPATWQRKSDGAQLGSGIWFQANQMTTVHYRVVLECQAKVVDKRHQHQGLPRKLVINDKIVVFRHDLTINI